MKKGAWISAEKRYTYSTYVNSWSSRPVVFKDVKVEFIWDIKRQDALIVISFDGKFYEPDYNPFSFVNSAKTFLKVVKEIENIPSIEELQEYLNKLN